MNTKDIGNIGEHLAIVELLKLGAQVSRPLGDNSRYDLIVDINGKLLTVQVKSNNQTNKDYVEFLLTSKNVLTQVSSTYDVDMFILVDITNSFVYAVFNSKEINKSLRLRYTQTSSGNTTKVKYAIDYLIDRVLASAPD